MLVEGEGFHDMPLGGWPGRFLGASAVPEPQPPVDHGLVIEPPPWQHQLESGDLDLNAALAPPALTPVRPEDALAELKVRNGDDEWPDLPGPPIVLEPLLPVQIPEPDWRAEELEHAQRERLERETDPDDEGYPAKRRQP